MGTEKKFKYRISFETDIPATVPKETIQAAFHCLLENAVNKERYACTAPKTLYDIKVERIEDETENETTPKTPSHECWGGCAYC